MKSKKEIFDIINNSQGTDAYHKFSLIPNCAVATDGAIALANAGECFWLLDIIVSYQIDKRLDPYFQVWTLSINLENCSAVVNGFNDTDLVVTQDITYTSFPLEKVKLFLIDGVILLPSEY